MIELEKAVAVIEKDNIIHGALVDIFHGALIATACESPGHCAIGALLFAAGATNEELGKWKGDPEDWEPGDRADELLIKNYGLRRMHAHDIIVANDSCGSSATVQDRRNYVIAELRRLAAAEQLNPEFDKKNCDNYDYPEPEPSYDLDED